MKNLIRLLNLPSNIALITVTSDGCFLGQAFGDIGFNHFFGKPSFHAGVGKERSQHVWKSLSYKDQRDLARLAPQFNLDLRTILR